MATQKFVYADEIARAFDREYRDVSGTELISLEGCPVTEKVHPRFHQAYTVYEMQNDGIVLFIIHEQNRDDYIATHSRHYALNITDGLGSIRADEWLVMEEVRFRFVSTPILTCPPPPHKAEDVDDRECCRAAITLQALPAMEQPDAGEEPVE